jgi:hypothetical protein
MKLPRFGKTIVPIAAVLFSFHGILLRVIDRYYFTASDI